MAWVAETGADFPLNFSPSLSFNNLTTDVATLVSKRNCVSIERPLGGQNERMYVPNCILGQAVSLEVCFECTVFYGIFAHGQEYSLHQHRGVLFAPESANANALCSWTHVVCYWCAMSSVSAFSGFTSCCRRAWLDSWHQCIKHGLIRMIDSSEAMMNAAIYKSVAGTYRADASYM